MYTIIFALLARGWPLSFNAVALSGHSAKKKKNNFTNYHVNIMAKSVH